VIAPSKRSSSPASPLTRRQAVAIGAVAVEHLDRTLKSAGLCMITICHRQITIAEALRTYLTQLIANVVQGGRIRSGPRGLIDDEIGPLISRVKELAIRWSHSARGLGSYAPFQSGSVSAKRALAVVRTEAHLRDILPLSRSARRRHDLAFAWIAFRAQDVEAIVAQGERVVLASSYADLGWREILGFQRELTAAGRAWRVGPRPIQAAGEWPVIVARVQRALRLQLPSTLMTARSLTKAFAEVVPDLLFVGNPLVMEGTLAVAAARASGVPVATMQHGEISSNTDWSRSGVDLMTVWGAHARRILMESGFPERRIAVTGAPWIDGLKRKSPAAKRRAGPRTILVAMSGAGDAVGFAEHFGHVQRLLEASRELRDHRWVFRLHPKDDPEIYTTLMAQIPGSHGEITRPKGVGIHSQLEESDLLITITSSSAFDAMLARVPVLTLARPSGEPSPRFVSDGATTHVSIEESLAKRIQQLFERGEPEETRASAERFVANLFFGAQDGAAADRMADAIAALLGPDAHVQPSRTPSKLMTA
jgi:UDP-N-acetylglucosamine 2-epimerase